MRSEHLALGLLLLSAVAVRAYRLDQPIVENYVGRQVPTAMVARNLDRGSGFLYPQLDTGPFPSYFVVEPPLYPAAVVVLRRVTGLPLDAAGRLVSALGLVLAAWGLHGLVRRRDGPRSALLAAGFLVVLPLTIRYGRAFQPDALMLGAVLAGANAIDRGGRIAGMGGRMLLALGIALKLTSAFVFLPLLISAPPGRRSRRAFGFILILVPAMLWYAHASRLIATGGGSQAMAGAGRAWLEALGPLALLDRENLSRLARFLLVRSFTPMALPLIGLSCIAGSTGDRFWRLWTIGCVGMLLLVGGKLHHEYYLLLLAPPVAVGMARGLGVIEDRLGGAAAVLATVALGTLAGFGVRSTWQTPEEWRSLGHAATIVRRVVPPDAELVAPEALLYASDRRGARLEIGPGTVRAAREWGETIDPDSPLALVRLYQSRGARYFADLTDPPPDAARRALHVAVRRGFPVRYDDLSLLIADLTVPGERLDEPQGAAGDRAGLRPLEGRGPQDRRPDGL